MIKKNYIRESIIVILFLLTIGMAMLTPSFASSEGKSVKVYLTVSKDNEFVTGVDGTVMAHVPFTVTYFDLKDIGLEKYYRYESEPFEIGGHYISGSKVVEQPTLLHCFIEALGQYYTGRPLTSSDVHSDAINVTGTPQELYMTQFWGHNYNLMYFVDHAYPLMSPGIGATCDYILLDENNEIDVAMFSDGTFRMSGAFCSFNKSEAYVNCGNEQTLTLTGVPMYESSEGQTVPPEVMPDETIRISSDFGNTWEDAGVTTDSSGSFTLKFDSAGTYYVSAGPNFNKYKHVAPPICVVTVSGGSVDPPPGPGPDPGPGPEPEDPLADAREAAKAELDNYKDPALYREAQQTELMTAINDGKAAIDAAEDKEGIDAALSAAKAAIDLIKTDADLTEEERKAEEEHRKEEERKAKEEAVEKANEILAQVSELDAGVYTAESFKAVMNARAALEALLAKEDSASTEILAAREALEQAVSGLVQMKQNTLKVTRKNKTFRVKTLKKARKSYKAVTVKGAKGKVTYKITGSSKSRKALKFNKKTGKITVKKGTKKGTYKLKIRVKAAGTALYLAGSKTVTVKVRVK